MLLGGRGAGEGGEGRMRTASASHAGGMDQRSHEPDNMSQATQITDDDIPF